MFTSDDTATLEMLIDPFQVPMFIADANIADRESFTLRAINSAHTAASQMDQDHVRDIAIVDLLPSDDARAVNQNYARCLASGQPLDYRETLTINGLETQWHTTLAPTVSQDGCPRIVGNAVLVERRNAPDRQRKVFQDINYFSVQSQFQLARVSSYLDALDTQRNSVVSRIDLEVLSALCRTVDRTLQDIRALAEPRAHEALDAEPTYLLDTETPARRPASDPVRRSLERLSSILAIAS